MKTHFLWLAAGLGLFASGCGTTSFSLGGDPPYRHEFNSRTGTWDDTYTVFSGTTETREVKKELPVPPAE